MNFDNLSPELKEKAKACKSIEELRMIIDGDPFCCHNILSKALK